MIIRVALAGASGRMGQTLQDLIAHRMDMLFVGALASTALQSAAHPVVTDLRELDEPHVVIDFSQPEFTLEVARQCARYQVPLISGTTGLSQAQMYELEQLAEKIPLLWAPNMSTGVNLLEWLVRLVARALPESEAEIVEWHHHGKRDAPSGTALRLGEAVAEARGTRLEEVGEYGERTGARSKETIGFSVIRAGDVVGDHQVIFGEEGEALSLSHRATSRTAFASGALRAAKWLVNQAPGFYDMHDVLGLKEKIGGILSRKD